MKFQIELNSKGWFRIVALNSVGDILGKSEFTHYNNLAAVEINDRVFVASMNHAYRLLKGEMVYELVSQSTELVNHQSEVSYLDRSKLFSSQNEIRFF